MTTIAVEIVLLIPKLWVYVHSHNICADFLYISDVLVSNYFHHCLRFSNLSDIDKIQTVFVWIGAPRIAGNPFNKSNQFNSSVSVPIPARPVSAGYSNILLLPQQMKDGYMKVFDYCAFADSNMQRLKQASAWYRVK